LKENGLVWDRNKKLSFLWFLGGEPRGGLRGTEVTTTLEEELKIRAGVI
jgi:hypothetical protein